MGVRSRFLELREKRHREVTTKLTKASNDVKTKLKPLTKASRCTSLTLNRTSRQVVIASIAAGVTCAVIACSLTKG